jgi:hypothetical protein
LVNLLIQNLSNYAEDVNGRDHDGGTSDDGTNAMEQIRILERTDEDVHLCHEARETWKTEVSQTGYYISTPRNGMIFIKPPNDARHAYHNGDRSYR